MVKVCYFCRWRCQDFRMMEFHLRYHHTNERPYRCEFKCGEYGRPYILSRHYRMIHPNYSLIKQVKRSEFRKAGIQVLLCYFCKWRASDMSKMEIHLRYHHTNERPFRCKFKCGEYGRYDILSRHYKRIHPKYKFKITKAVDLFSCYFCNVSFQNLSNYYAHLSIHTKEAVHKCEKCDRRYLDYRSLDRHDLSFYNHGDCYKRTFHGIMKVARRSLDKRRRVSHARNKLTQPYSCGSGNNFSFLPPSKRTGIQENVYAVQVDIKKNSRCYFCRKIFLKKQSLQYHMRVHTREEHFQCKLCKAATYSDHQAKKHCESGGGCLKS